MPDQTAIERFLEYYKENVEPHIDIILNFIKQSAPDGGGQGRLSILFIALNGIKTECEALRNGTKKVPIIEQDFLDKIDTVRKYRNRVESADIEVANAKEKLLYGIDSPGDYPDFAIYFSAAANEHNLPLFLDEVQRSPGLIQRWASRLQDEIGERLRKHRRGGYENKIFRETLGILQIIADAIRERCGSTTPEECDISDILKANDHTARIQRAPNGLKDIKDTDVEDLVGCFVTCLKQGARITQPKYSLRASQRNPAG